MSGRVRGGFLIALALAIAFIAVAQPILSYYTTEASPQVEVQNVVNRIVLAANNPGIFNVYNTNGTPPSMSDNSAIFCGSNRTDMYQDIASYTAIQADGALVLSAQVTTSIK